MAFNNKKLTLAGNNLQFLLLSDGVGFVYEFIMAGLC